MPNISIVAAMALARSPCASLRVTTHTGGTARPARRPAPNGKGTVSHLLQYPVTPRKHTPRLLCHVQQRGDAGPSAFRGHTSTNSMSTLVEPKIATPKSGRISYNQLFRSSTDCNKNGPRRAPPPKKRHCCSFYCLKIFIPIPSSLSSKKKLGAV